MRDGGEKMSKTRGNVIDPLEAIDEYGADAVRFALASAASSGPTASLEKHRLADSRAFATKLWNASRFAMGQLEGEPPSGEIDLPRLALPDRWILSRLSAAAGEVSRRLALFRFDEAAQAIYGFVWRDLCDGYIEMVKPRLSAADADPADRQTARRGPLALPDGLARAAPSVHAVRDGGDLGEAHGPRRHPHRHRLPAERPEWSDVRSETAVEALRSVVTRVRNFRSERGAGPTEPVDLVIDPVSPDAESVAALRTLAPLLAHLGRLSALRFEDSSASPTRDVVSGVALGLALARPAAADPARTEKSLADIDDEIQSLSAKLRNPSFIERAPAPVVEKTRRRLVELEQRRAALGGAGA